MTFLPFLPTTDAMELLERHYEDEAQASEYEADLGASYFYGGASSWDAQLMAREHMDALREDFERSEEGQLYTARLEAAQFMQSGITPDMRLRSVTESSFDTFGRFVQGPTIPEFYPGDSARRGERPAPSHDDIPF